MTRIPAFVIFAVFLLIAAPWSSGFADEVQAPGPSEARTTEDQASGKAKSGKPEQARSDESAQSQSMVMPEVVVTATRTKEKVADLPQSVTVVTQEDIETRQPRTPNQMLREEPGIFTIESAVQGSPVIRGQIGNRVLYLWDGIPINNGALFGGPNGYFNQFPLGAIERMEVVRGQGSVQYGSGAIGGVINIISKTPDEYATAGSKPGGDVTSRFGTVDKETTSYGDVWYSDGRFSFIGGPTFESVGDTYGPGVGIMKNTGFNALGGYFNMEYKVAADQALRFTGIYNDRYDVETYVQSKLNPGGIPRVFDPYEMRGIGKLEYEIENMGSLSSNLKMYSYYQEYGQERQRRVESASALADTRTTTDQSVYGGGAQMTTPLYFFGNSKLIYGIDYRHEDLGTSVELYNTVKSTDITKITVPAGKVPDGTYDVADAFAMWETHPLKNLTVTLGGRYENTHLHSEPGALDVIPNAGYTLDDLKLNKYWSSPTWSIGAIYGFTPQLDLAGNIASGFRAPTFSDTLSTGTPIFSSKVASVPSPGVEPEKSITYEIGPRYHSEVWNASLTGYYTQLTDVIRSVADGTVVIPGQGTFTALRNTNAGAGYVWGTEFACSFKPLPNWTIFGNATYTMGADTNFDENYRFIPPLFGIVGVRYDSPSKRWWLEAAENLVDRLRHHAPLDETDATFSTDPGFGSPSATNPPLRRNYEIPGYAVTNIRGGWKVWQDQNTGRRFDLTLDVNNLLNQPYREAYSQQELVAPGINFIVAGKLTF